MLANALIRSEIIDLPDLGAGVSVANEVGWVAPDGGARIQSARVIFREATAGVAAGNSLTVTAQTPAGQIITTGALAANQPAGTVLTPPLTAANARMTPGQALTFSITQVAAADIGRAELQIDYTPLTGS